MTAITQIAARLPNDLVSEIDRTKVEDSRSTRTDQLIYLVRIGLAGRARLAEIERQASATITGNQTGGTGETIRARSAHRAGGRGRLRRE